MSRLMVPAAAVAAAAAIVTAGCASAGASGPGSGNGAAAVVPANAVAFVAASTDLGSSQWHGLVKPFLTQFQTLAPALGGELDVAILPGKQVVGFTQPGDATKLAALATKHNLQTRVIGGWTAVAKTPATLDTVAGATAHLADNVNFTAAMKQLPDGALVRAYATAQAAQNVLASIPGVLQTIAVPNDIRYRLTKTVSANRLLRFAATTNFQWLAADLTSTKDGLKADVFVHSNGLVASVAQPRYVVQPTPQYTPSLIDEIPSGALAVIDFEASPGMFEDLPQLPAELKTFFPAQNTPDIPLLLDTVVGGETALYVRPSLPTPEVTLVTQPSDTAKASAALDQIIADLPAKSMLAGVKLYRTTIGGQFVVSTTQQGLDDFRGGGAKLSSDPSFLAAQRSAGMGAETTGFVYANVKDALPLLSLAGVKLPAGMPSLGTFLAYGASTAGQSTFSAFLGVG